jgi:hypothetical protein
MTSGGLLVAGAEGVDGVRIGRLVEGEPGTIRVL